jgi:hypothetical protein
MQLEYLVTGPGDFAIGYEPVVGPDKKDAADVGSIYPAPLDNVVFDPECKSRGRYLDPPSS